MFNRSRGYKVVVKWFTLLGLQYSTAPKQLLLLVKSATQCTDLDKCFWYRGTHSRKFTSTMDDQCVVRNGAGVSSVQLWMYFLLCAIGHGSAVLLCSVGEILLLCSANLHNLVAQTSTFQLFKQHSIIAHFQRGSVAEEAEEGGRGGRD